MKKTYEAPEMELIEFSVDIVTGSLCTSEVPPAPICPSDT